jgi:glutamine amidotransferase
MECNVPTDIVFSFSGLALRGGARGPHADGWGLALYEGRTARTFLEPAAASDSALAAFVRAHPIKTLLAIAHVRKRTRGPINLANTHPFVRELWGRHFTFAHNGTVRRARARGLPSGPSGSKKATAPRGRFSPIGTTDSEHAFCAILNRLDRAFPAGYPDPEALSRAVAKAGREIGEDGTFNFLLADGSHLYARCATRLCYIVRKAPFATATLADDDLSIDFAQVTTPRDRVAVIATVPLTRDERWTMGKPGEMWVFRRGRLVDTLAS